MSDETSTPLARVNDPGTSRAAGEEARAHLANLVWWAVQCVEASPGPTQRELGARYCKDDPRRIGRRLCECERKGLLRRGVSRRCTVSGRQAETWWPVESGGGK